MIISQCPENAVLVDQDGRRWVKFRVYDGGRNPEDMDQSDSYAVALWIDRQVARYVGNDIFRRLDFTVTDEAYFIIKTNQNVEVRNNEVVRSAEDEDPDTYDDTEQETEF